MAVDPARRLVMFGTLRGRGLRLLDLLWRKPEPLTPPAPLPPPAVFHITHQKAGSQWINRIFHTLTYERLVHPELEVVPTHELPIEGTQFLNRPVEESKIYPTLYLTREQFESVPIPANHTRFVVIRDPRDTLVSAYFSYKFSHSLVSDWMRDCRIELNRLSVEDGLMFLLNTWLPVVTTFQWSWVASGEKLIKYEELLANDEEILTKIFREQCRLEVDPVRLHEVLIANRFEAWSGRARGEEDVRSHERKGIAGDWKNYFTDKIARAFRSRYASLLVATGYEKNERW